MLTLLALAAVTLTPREQAVVEAYRFHCVQPHMEETFKSYAQGLFWLCEVDPEESKLYDWMRAYETQDAKERKLPMMPYRKYIKKHPRSE